MPVGMLRFLLLLAAISHTVSFQQLRNFHKLSSKFHSAGRSVSLELGGPSVKDESRTYHRIISSIVGLLLTFGPFEHLQLAAHAKNFPIFDEVYSIVKKNYYDGSYNNMDIESFRNEALSSLNAGKTSESAQIKLLLRGLGDKYSRLLDQSTYESLWKYDAIGVGLLFQSDSANGLMHISAPPIKDSSGFKAGIKEGDIVYSVNGQSTTKMTAIQLLEMLSNDPSDTLTLELGDSSSSEGSRRIVKLARQLQDRAQNPVRFSSQTIRDKNTGRTQKIGYIFLKEFNAQSVPGMKEALKLLANDENVDAIALDLRGNPGGGFQFAINIGGMFLDKDQTMVTAAGKEYDRTSFKASYPEGVLFSRPLVLITDGLSASASEVLAAGLHDNCRAATIGQKTFGKGKIQAVFGLQDGEGLTLTVAQYLSPSGRVIQNNGIDPDLVVKVTNPILNSFLGAPSFTAVDLNNVDLEAAFENMQKSCRIDFNAL